MARHHPPTASKHAPPLLALLALAVLNLFPAGCFFAGSIGDIDVRKLEGLMKERRDSSSSTTGAPSNMRQAIYRAPCTFPRRSSTGWRLFFP
jgi:hypothetical protein